MLSLMIGPGVVGSPTDVATLVVASVTLWRVMQSQNDGHAVTAAMAESLEEIDAARVRADLGVDRRDSEQYLRDGGGDA